LDRPLTRPLTWEGQSREQQRAPRRPGIAAALVATIAVVVMVVAAPAARAAVGLDSSFGSGGTVLTPFGTPIGNGDARANAVVLQGDGKLVAAGYGKDGRNDKFALARYNPDGSLDAGFGTSGTVLTQIGIGEGSHDEITAMVLLADGKLAVAGYAAFGLQEFALARYNSDGSPDTSFNPNGTMFSGLPGTVLTAVGNAGIARAMSLVEQPDGKLVAAGYARDGRVAKFALVRYDTNGSPDAGFGSGGTVATPVGDGSFATVTALALRSDGKLLAAGTAADGGIAKFALARYNPDGSLDTSFGSGGVVLTPVGTGDAVLDALFLDSDGRAIVAGSAKDGARDEFALARFLPDGSLDTSFGSSGIVLTAVGSDGASGAGSLAADGTGLLAAGVASDGGVAKFALVRYDESGAPDPAFGPAGAVLTAIGDGSFASAESVLLDGGTPVAAGYARDGGAHLFALARYRDIPAAGPPPPPPPPAPPAACFNRLEVVVCPGASLRSQAAASGRCRVKSRWTTMRKGHVKVRVSCPAAARGTLKLQTTRSHKHRHRRTLGHRSFRLKKGGSTRVTVRLSRRTRRTIRRERRIRARALVAVKRVAASRVGSSSRKLTLQARKRSGCKCAHRHARKAGRR
jgi:uncharacterized delta-60 repeat protein